MPQEWGAASVEAQTGGPTSTLELYRSALRLRPRSEEFSWRDGPDGTMSFDRGDLTVAVNFDAPGLELPPGELVLASEPDVTTTLPADTAAWIRRSDESDAQMAHMKQYSLYIGGEDVDAASGASFDALNPTTGETWATHALAGAVDVDRAVRAAAAAFESGAWRGLSPTRRGRLMMGWADVIAERGEGIAEVEVADNGKLYKEMLGAAAGDPGLALLLRRPRGQGRGPRHSARPHERPQLHAARAARRRRDHHPLELAGPADDVLARAALAAGNTVVVKPSEHASASVLETLRLAEEAGFPPGVINVVTGAREAGEALVDHPAVAKISFTGSEGTGAAIAAKAGARLAPRRARLAIIWSHIQ